MTTKTTMKDKVEYLNNIKDQFVQDSTIPGWGKRGHGMNGEDADLDRIGQCVVEDINFWEETREVGEGVGTVHVMADIALRLYARITSPSYVHLEDWRDTLSFAEEDALKTCGIDVSDDETLLEYLREQATEIVRDMNATPGDPFAFMWDGDGAWDGGIDVNVNVEIEDIDNLMHSRSLGYQDKFEDDIKRVLAFAIHNANDPDDKVFCPKLKTFEDEVGLCNDLIKDLLHYGEIRPAFIVERAHLDDTEKGQCKRWFNSGAVSHVGPFRTRSDAAKYADHWNTLPYSEATVVDLVSPKNYSIPSDK